MRWLSAFLLGCTSTYIPPDADVLDAAGARPLGPSDYGFPIWGIHFYGDSPSVESTIGNGQPFWSVEMLYTTDWGASDPAAERRKLEAIRDRGFRVILRLDYDRTFTVPPNGDWDARWAYTTTAGEIAATMGDVVDVYVIGNEMTSQAAPEVRDAGWYACVYNGCDANSVFDRVHANDATATVLMGALSPWPWWMDQIGMDNVVWLEQVMDGVDQDNGPQIDGYAIHAYSSPDNASNPASPIEDPRSGDVTGLHGFVPFLERIYARHGASVPVHVTETNTYWMASGFADRSYRDDWIKEAYQAIGEWNRANDLKILSFDWYVYSHLGLTDPASDLWGNALMRTDNPRLDRARADFSWVTANADLAPEPPGGALRFEAENFTNSGEWSDEPGLEGVDWHDVDTANHGGSYRNGPGGQSHVDIGLLPDWSGFFVGWMEPGEWMRYHTLSGGRTVRFVARYARGAGGNGSFGLTVDGVRVATLTAPSTGSWDAYTTATSGSFWLPQGTHDLRIEADSGATNLDWFELVP